MPGKPPAHKRRSGSLGSAAEMKHVMAAALLTASGWEIQGGSYILPGTPFCGGCAGRDVNANHFSMVLAA